MVKLQNLGIKIKPSVIKQKVHNTTKTTKRIVYCVAIYENDNWIAKVNTKGLENHENITILSFTERSFSLKGRINIFYYENNKPCRYIRSRNNAILSPDKIEGYYSLINNHVFSGYLIKYNGKEMFDMIEYIGKINRCQAELNKNYKKSECN